MTLADLHTLTGTYAAHALPESEREEFERHLAACPSCDQEVTELQATAGRLGLAAVTAVPPGTRDRVLRQITNVRQEPPKVPSHQPAGQGGGGSGLRTRFLRLALAASLAAAAALGGVAAWQYQSAQDAHGQTQASRQQSDELNRVLASPDAQMTGGKSLPGDGSGSVVVSRERGRAAFLASGMEKPPSGKTYQLWFADGTKMRSAGLLESGGGSSATLMKGKLGAASAMGITLEPAGGSKQPTSAPLTLMQLPKAKT
ncbi:anti-sigma factor [Streptomyces nanshensis]|nr:anti-sigma factor [Streptomyces nanshensis]